MKKTSHHCAAILGGQNNVVNHDYAAVFGNGLSSAAADTFHVSCINAINTPSFVSGGFPAGTLQYILAPAILGFPLGTCMVLIG